MKYALKIATLVASVVLTGCAVDNGGGYPSAVAQTASGTPSVAEQACLAAVSNETNNGDVTILSSEFSEANSLVMVGVGEQRAPWRCLVSNNGAVQEIMFTGDDSAGVPTAAPMASETPSVAEQACLAAVSNETNNGDVTILSSEFSEANSLVMVGVGEQRAPWRCLVSNDGVVAEVMFSGDEGAL